MEAINIRFRYNDPDPEAYLVEIEDDNGRSIRVGEWIKDGEYQKLRITSREILALPSGDEVERAEALAERFHEAYEQLAPYHGHKTNKETAVPWKDMPHNHKQLMVHVCAKLLRQGI